MTDKTLPERMREAAPLFEEVAARINACSASEFPCSLLSARDLRDFADRWEHEDAEKASAEAALDAEVEELAAWICNSVTPFCWNVCRKEIRDLYRGYARDLIAAGWRKQATP